MAQSDYLNRVQLAARQQFQLKTEESIQKEDFRRQLEAGFQRLLSEKYPTIDSAEVRLKCYGSLNNGFALANCDMDLLLALPNEIDLINKVLPEIPIEVPASSVVVASTETPDTRPPPDSKKFEVALLLEEHLLAARIGARLLTRTRVPILRVCETPDDEQLEDLRRYRKESDEAAIAEMEKTQEDNDSTPPTMSVSDIAAALTELSSEKDAAEVTLPASPPKGKPASLEFTGDCGIQCDINFTNFVAVHNTRLLREYSQYDSRVTEIGTFVKAWAKIRKINTPYLGTLSSYGYVLMVLHYLMNVVKPPVIPNLQDLARAEDSWHEGPVPLFEDKYDIRFWQDEAKITAYKGSQPRNRESTGHLLRGFFWYYSAREGFNFKNDIVSIRTKGGLLRKQQKGWTEAKWSSENKSVRQRYLLAVEDPFEVDHNVARVVGHNGIVAIRDEFRRAWDIIARVGGPLPLIEDLMQPAEDRGDLLRKDQEHHREKMRKMRQEVEAREKQALQQNAEPSEHQAANAQQEGRLQGPSKQAPSQDNGTFTLRSTPSTIPSPPALPTRRRRTPEGNELTRCHRDQQAKPRQRRNGRVRKVLSESEDEDETGSSPSRDVKKPPTAKAEEHDQKAECGMDGCESDLEPSCSPSDICRSQGYDLDGNPVAWDMSTQDGRWLQWRDTKIRQGVWRGCKNETLLAHHKRYPYDSRRPAPEDGRDYKLANEHFFVNQAPYPMKKLANITSTESAVSANLRKAAAPRKNTTTRKKNGAGRLSTNNLFANQVDAHPILRPDGDGWTAEGQQAVLGADDARVDKIVDHGRDVSSEEKSSIEADKMSSRADPKVVPSGVREVGPTTAPAADEEWPENVVSRSSAPRKTNIKISAHNSLSADALQYLPTIHAVTEFGRHRCYTTSLTEDKLEPEKSAQSDSAITPFTTAPTKAKSVASADTEVMPDTAFIRCRRLAFFAEKEKRESMDEESEAPKSTNIAALMRESGISPPLKFNEPMPQLDRLFQAARSPDKKPSTDLAIVVDEAPTSVSSSFATATTCETSITTPAVYTECDSKEQTPQVPLTLYPDMTNEERPRDEDPRIMPIPRELGFRFDVRQLRDLAVIKEGGNGCAIAGCEFEIQDNDEDEWIGSGAVDWRTRLGYEDDVEIVEQADYEYGRGDEEGLLHELPGPDI